MQCNPHSESGHLPITIFSRTPKSPSDLLHVKKVLISSCRRAVIHAFDVRSLSIQTVTAAISRRPVRIFARPHKSCTYICALTQHAYGRYSQQPAVFTQTDQILRFLYELIRLQVYSPAQACPSLPCSHGLMPFFMLHNFGCHSHIVSDRDPYFSSVL